MESRRTGAREIALMYAAVAGMIVAFFVGSAALEYIQSAPTDASAPAAKTSTPPPSSLRYQQ